jgi:anti-sigma B factor antagonist
MGQPRQGGGEAHRLIRTNREEAVKFKTMHQGGVTVIVLQGNLMGGPDATALNGKLHELIDAGKTSVVIDLAGVEFMNSSGLGLLIGGVSTMRGAGGSLRLANASEKIAGLITITKLGSLFDMYPSVDAAVAAIKQS